MKYVLITADVHVKDPRTGKPALETKETGGTPEPIIVSMQSFVRDSICNDQRIGRGGDGIRRIIRLEKAFDPLNATIRGGKRYASVESGDHQKVMEIVNDMNFASPLVGRQLVDLVEAWEKALDELPAEDKPRAEA
jgi:hypothetical protein